MAIKGNSVKIDSMFVLGKLDYFNLWVKIDITKIGFPIRRACFCYI